MAVVAVVVAAVVEAERENNVQGNIGKQSSSVIF